MNSTVLVKALVVRAAGTNCDQETIYALKLAGAESDLVHINQLMLGRVRLHPYQMLIFPGGFSYGDDISAGKVLANELRFRLKDQLRQFVESKKLVIGICNGFQVLVKSGLLPGFSLMNEDEEQSVTLALNASGRFQCEWICLKTEQSAATWLHSLPEQFDIPIAHGEGRFVVSSPAMLSKLKRNKQIIFRYHGRNPNGSVDDIAGVCNPLGNVVGLMPHPERFVTRFQHPNWPHLPAGIADDAGDGFWFWKQAVNYAKNFVH